MLPSGKIPSALPEVIAPDYTGKVYIDSYGYKTTIKLNGTNIEPDKSTSKYLPVGIRRGKNYIEIKIEPIPHEQRDPNRPVSIIIDAIQPDKAPYLPVNWVPVFHFEKRDFVGTTIKEFVVVEEDFRHSV
jgi:hypothetical protein